MNLILGIGLLWKASSPVSYLLGADTYHKTSSGDWWAGEKTQSAGLCLPSQAKYHGQGLTSPYPSEAAVSPWDAPLWRDSGIARYADRAQRASLPWHVFISQEITSRTSSVNETGPLRMGIAAYRIFKHLCCLLSPLFVESFLLPM